MVNEELYTLRRSLFLSELLGDTFSWWIKSLIPNTLWHFCNRVSDSRIGRAWDINLVSEANIFTVILQIHNSHPKTNKNIIFCSVMS